jgi:hypothetical protein
LHIRRVISESSQTNGLVGGGSGPRYLNGWITVILGFDDALKAIFFKPDEKKEAFGQVDTADIPGGVQEVPVVIDDNGRIYNTIFVAGSIVNVSPGDGSLHTRLDWALVEKTPDV